MERTKIIVLGGGLVGGPMALDLAAEQRFAVTVVDVDPKVLEELQTKRPELSVMREDLSSASRVSELVGDYDLVLSAVPGSMGYATLDAIIEARRTVVDISFFAEDEVKVAGVSVRPIDVTAAVLLPAWEMGPSERDLTVLHIEVCGRRDGQEVRHTFRLLDRYDPSTDTLSMARTTGYTATAAMRMLVEGLYREPGIAPPELIGRHREPYEFIMRCLRERDVVCVEEVDGGPPVLP